eukprot:TRINITY_DN276_c0_g2_i1.p1 TRINITY_DN276_c0_g2~~TRINITY_DN276_c0_g2_i1.p1  ORF type:complete len:382 (+),score=161.67 TRINITY_DN276_c0_g2_i1:62-1207(+)
MVAASRVAVLAASLFSVTNAVTLRNTFLAAPVNHTATPANTMGSTEKAEAGKDEAAVAAARTKLQKVSAGLSSLLGPTSSLANSPIAPELKAFSAELAKTLKDTEHAADSQKALKQLRDAQAGVSVLMKDLTAQQTRLMKESDGQEESLLLGVLMTKKDEAREKQMEVLQSDEFKHLAVVEAVLAAKDTKTPLFQQVAGYLDKHSSSGKAPTPAKVGKDGKPDLSAILTSLQARIQHLENAEKDRKAHHDAEMKKFDDIVATESKKSQKVAHHFQLMKKSSDRQFKKEESITDHDIASLKDAVVAINKGDFKMLEKAQEALQEHLKQMQSLHGNGFVVFLQTAHRIEGKDCPYCAAQCIEKCNAAGKSYTTCLTECADAGK